MGAQHPALAFLPDKDEMISLHWAADRGHVEILQLLLVGAKELNKADCVNVKDANGDTPLHFAVMSEHEAASRLLLSYGADPDIENADGETARSQAEGEVW